MGAHARRGDLIILGDVDEIPRPETLAALRACPFEGKHNCANLDGSFFYYSYSGYAGEWLAGPKVRLAVKGTPYVANMAEVMPCPSSGMHRILLMLLRVSSSQVPCMKAPVNTPLLWCRWWRIGVRRQWAEWTRTR